MKIEIGNVVENEDGSITVDTHYDAEFLKEAVQHYLIHMLKCALDSENDEYQIKEPAKTEGDNDDK